MASSSPSTAWAEVRQVLRRASPALRDLPASEPPRIDTGQNAIVWNAGPFIVRMPRHDDQVNALRREAAILRVIGPTLPLPTPDVDLHTLPDGRTIAIHRALPGHPLAALPEDDAAIAASLGGFLQALHARPLTDLDGLALPVANLGHWRTWLREATTRLAPYLDGPAHRRLADAGEAFLVEIGAISPVLIHGDFGKGNILANEGRITGIIDFGSVQIGDPASDFAGLVASYGDALLSRVAVAHPLATDPAVRTRITFYRLAFAAMDALYGLDHADAAAFRAGIASLSKGIASR